MAQVKSRGFTAPKFMPVNGAGAFFNDQLTVATAPAVNDTLDFAIPAGLELSLLRLRFTDMDSNGTPLIAFKVGYVLLNADGTTTTVDDYFAGAGQTTARTGGLLDCLFAPIKFNVDALISITVTAAPATFAAGTVFMTAAGNCDGPK